MRRAILVSGWTLVWSGLFILGFVGYQLYGTGFQTAQAQDEARAELEEIFAATPATTTTTSPEPDDEVVVEEQPPELVSEESVGEGDPFAAIRIPKIDVDHVVFEGVQLTTLQSGPGHIPGSPLPGQPGNAVISGHRTTYGQPFHDLDLLTPGDSIFVETAIGTHEYQMRSVEIVSPTDVWVLDDREGAWLTLTTCHPKYSARERLIIFAELVDGPNLEAITAQTPVEPA